MDEGKPSYWCNMQLSEKAALLVTNVEQMCNKCVNTSFILNWWNVWGSLTFRNDFWNMYVLFADINKSFPYSWRHFQTVLPHFSSFVLPVSVAKPETVLETGCNCSLVSWPKLFMRKPNWYLWKALRHLHCSSTSNRNMRGAQWGSGAWTWVGMGG